MSTAQRYEYIGWEMDEDGINEIEYYSSEKDVKHAYPYYINVAIPTGSSKEGGKCLGVIPLQK
jgi:hypothetical protein